MKNFCSLCWRSVRTLERVGAFFVSTTVFWVGVTLAIVVLSFSLLAFTPSCGLGAIGRKRVVFNILLSKMRFPRRWLATFVLRRMLQLNHSLSLSLFLSRGVNAILYFRTQLNSTTLGIACRKENQKTNQKLQTTTREKCVSKTSSPLAGYQRAFGFRFSSFGRVDVDAVTTLRLLSFKRNRGKEPGTARPSALIFLQVRALSSRCLSSEFGSLLSSLSSLCLLSVSLFCKKKQKNSVKI